MCSRKSETRNVFKGLENMPCVLHGTRHLSRPCAVDNSPIPQRLQSNKLREKVAMGEQRLRDAHQEQLSLRKEIVERKQDGEALLARIRTLKVGLSYVVCVRACVS